LRTLDPGASYTATVTWGLTKGSNHIARAGPIGVVHNPLSAWEEGHQQVRVSGIFSSFCQGSARLVYQNAAGKRLGTHDLGAIPCAFAQAISIIVFPPPGTEKIALEILDFNRKSAGILDICPLPAGSS